MLVLGIIAFCLNWAIAWTLVRGNSGAVPLAIMTASTTGITFAMGIVVSLGMIQMGFPPAEAVQESMDMAIYFGLPAAAWASICASQQNRREQEQAAR